MFRVRKRGTKPKQVEKKTTPDRTPPPNCKGYPPALLRPPDSSCKEESFFLKSRTAETCAATAGHNGAGVEVERRRHPELACTLTFYPKGPGSVSTSAGSGPTKGDVQKIVQSIDSDRPVLVICHGAYSWRNQMLLGNLATALAARSGSNVLRFDFRGNGHSGGRWSYAGYDGEFEDLCRILAFVKDILGCRVACVVGHSKGTAAVLRFAWEQSAHNRSGQSGADETIKDQEEKYGVTVPCFVNMSGRYQVPGEFDPTQIFSQDQLDELFGSGKFLSAPERDGDKFEITQRDIDERVAFDTSSSEMIQSPVLTIHGGKDTVVDPVNARRYNSVIP